MKKMNHLIFFVITGFVLLMCLINFYLAGENFGRNGREYRISINRIEQAVSEYEAKMGTAPDNLQKLQDFSDAEYPMVTGISAISIDSTRKEQIHFLTEKDDDYVVLATGDYYYKVTYEDKGMSNMLIRWIVNGVCGCIFLVLLFVLLYIRGKILLPFYKLSEIPYELSKGNLTVPLKENKNRFFGRFVWGMDLLRENLEENKAKELELQKEKKLLLLSLSHDIKTPLSAIKLYAKALSKNLYRDENKKREIAENINEKVDEIESYISEIVRASNEDFLHFDVENSEVYIRDVVEQVKEYYVDKMQLNQIGFEVGNYSNCLVFGDSDRLVEVIQNVIENAIKYGDGKRIWLEFEQSEEEFEICIYNTGCILEKKELLHIFDSFFRGSNVGKRPGSGLGLYICRELMHLMEGEITARVIRQEEEYIMAVKVAVHVV
ncbi:MAG: HAMP domain-containing histidine kinase [Lachnospiraceae bacterium]|nr:HAMP domain-containing histidine kinase [Lachnospiraceae bacterium]